MKITNRRAQQMYNALRTLGTRRMNGLSADLKVTRLLTALTPIVEPLARLKQTRTAEMLESDASEGTTFEQEKLALSIAIEIAKLDDLVIEFSPDEAWLLDRSDLPQDKKSDKSSGNADGLGTLLADLGPLYIDEDEEK